MTKQRVNRFERNTGSEGPSISLGRATINLGGGERTLGYRYTETILPVDTSVYVLGTVQEGGGIGAPSGDEGHRFVFSHRSEETLGQSLGKTLLWLGVGGIASIVVGVVLLVIGIFVLIAWGRFANRPYAKFSKMPAAPIPPPMHMVTMP